MLEKLEKWILKKKKDPCKKCLVKMICRKNYNSACEEYKKFEEFKETIGNIKIYFEDVFILLILAIIVITFLLGLYQWYQIFASIPLSKWLF